ncbi:pyridoxamine 5'-phosphate oxidase family protein [Streptomyces sp. NBC_01537]|uniref:pyridoxamine 5'-phosphate oxidase family protein n=1 Tax=Streptomyces sp. NBC_01537 TaxID=2903896 RepID=UPI00386B72AA
MTTSTARTPRQRHHEALRRLEHDVDVWVATADAEGVPCMVPLAFWWDGAEVWLATRETNPTGRNLGPSGPGRARLALGDTRDLVLIDGTARVVRREDLPEGVGDAFAAKAEGWDPREDGPSYVYYAVRPEWMQAWGTVAEMRDRDLMRDGVWLL